MIGKGIDLLTLFFLALGLLKGFKKGLIRELFGLLGAIFAVIVAYHGYQRLALVLIEKYSLIVWQAEAIAFVGLLLGISLLGVLLGYIWSKAISFTPFVVLDQMGGALFGLLKVGLVILFVMLFLNTLHLTAVDEILQESIVAHQTNLLLPFFWEYMGRFWPGNWYQPDWLFPEEGLVAVTRFFS